MLAELDRENATRFVVLLRRLGVSRQTLSQTLGSLVDEGLVARNPGYGHPLRPEYLLTEDGRPLARRCARLLDALPERERSLKKWTLPVLAAVGPGRRFSELADALSSATPRALALALKDLQTLGLVERTVTDDYPPSTSYRPTDAGRELQRLL